MSEPATASGLRIVVDRELCFGFGDCVDTAPAVFALDEHNVATVLDPDGARLDIIVEAAQLTAYDVVVSDWVVFTDDTVPGQLSDAPEGAIAFSSARPALGEVDEDEDTASGEAEEETTSDETAEDEDPAALDEVPELQVAEMPEEPAAAPKPKARARARKAATAEASATDNTDDEKIEEEDK